MASRLVTGVALALLVLGGAATARAESPSVEACLAANEAGQLAQKAAKYREARKQFSICAQSSCPAAVNQDCARWLDETERAQPTVIIQAREAGGRETSAVSVRIDDEIVAHHLDGRALAVDPGEHAFVFQAGAGQRIEQRHLVRENEKNRIIAVDFSTLPRSKPAPTTAPTSPDRSRGVPVASWVLGAAGIAAAGVGAYFVVTGKKRETELADSCAPRCPHDDVDAVRFKYWGGGIAIGVGVAAIATAVVIAASSPPKERAATPFRVAF